MHLASVGERGFTPTARREPCRQWRAPRGPPALGFNLAGEHCPRLLPQVRKTHWEKRNDLSGSSRVTRFGLQASSLGSTLRSGKLSKGSVFFLILTYVFQAFFPETRVETQGREGEGPTAVGCRSGPGRQESQPCAPLN